MFIKFKDKNGYVLVNTKYIMSIQLVKNILEKNEYHLSIFYSTNPEVEEIYLVGSTIDEIKEAMRLIERGITIGQRIVNLTRLGSDKYEC